MEILIKALQLILSLSILVVLHELGHFIPARIFKTRVEKFYLFFDPWFSIFKKKVGNTEYGIGWLPLGGYVKISGMIDESMDKEQMKLPAKDWEFRSKPAWQRLIIMLGGVTVNLILGVFIYSMILFFSGDSFLPNDSLENGVVCSDFAKTVGEYEKFKNGDKIILVDGEKITKFRDVNKSLILRDEPFSVMVERFEGGFDEIKIQPNFIKHWKDGGGEALFTPRVKTKVYRVLENSPAMSAGIEKGDYIVSINGKRSLFFDEFKAEVKNHLGQIVTMGIIRKDELKTLSVEISNEGKIGFENDMTLNIEKRNYSFLSSIPAGYNLAMEKLSEYISQFSLMFNTQNDLVSEMGGFGAIGNMFPPVWDWKVFWNLTAFLSLILAFMNLLPIPALDGGHVMFLVYEIIFRKPAPQKVLEYAQMIGVILLLSLLIFANGNDIIRMF
tara:strand:- start:30617 stop:31945 length:1329 start_codon:yes stop_codon:yes gene_type:complete